MTHVKTAARLMWEALREIFDENAYARFLLTHRLEDSRESYRRYLGESDSARERRPRCC